MVQSKLHVAGSAVDQEEHRVKPELLLGNITACPGAPQKVVFNLKNIPWSKVCSLHKSDFVGMLQVEPAHSINIIIVI